MDIIQQTINTACDELPDIPLDEIILESIWGQDDSDIHEAVNEWDFQTICTIFPHIRHSKSETQFYTEALIFYFFSKLQIYLGFVAD